MKRVGKICVETLRGQECHPWILAAAAQQAAAMGGELVSKEFETLEGHFEDQDRIALIFEVREL